MTPRELRGGTEDTEPCLLGHPVVRRTARRRLGALKPQERTQKERGLS
jgi:hypothetical protein